MDNNIRPVNHLNMLSKKFPNAWSLVEHRLKAKGKVANWPNWCFLPIIAWRDICNLGQKYINQPISLADYSELAAIGTWRYGLGVYRFDDDFRSCLVNSKLHEQLPSQALLRIPEFCIYLETPGLKFFVFDMHGCWVHLDYEPETSAIRMHFVFDTEVLMLPFSIEIGDWSLFDAVQKTLEKMDHDLAFEFDDTDDSAKAVGLTSDFATDIAPIFSMILYLCSESAEISDRKNPGLPAVRPAMKKTRRDGCRLFPPKNIRIWEIGYKIGARLRTERSSFSGDGNSRAIHQRRGHWHTFLTGPRDEERGKRVKWLPPMMIGMADNYRDDNREGTYTNKGCKRDTRNS